MTNVKIRIQEVYEALSVVEKKVADYFLEHARSRYIFPMHCWDNYRMIREYKEKNDARYPDTRIMEITGPGQEFTLE